MKPVVLQWKRTPDFRNGDSFIVEVDGEPVWFLSRTETIQPGTWSEPLWMLGSVYVGYGPASLHLSLIHI